MRIQLSFFVLACILLFSHQSQCQEPTCKIFPGLKYDAGIQNPSESLSGDFNGDGFTDVIVSGGFSFTERMAIIFGTENGGFAEPELSSILGDNLRIVGPAEDYDGDGDLDLLAVNADEIRIFFNDSTGNFTLNTFQPIDTVGFFQGTAKGDFDSDGNLDLLLFTNTRCYIYLNDGNFSFTEQFVTTFQSGVFLNLVNTGDFNNDGNLDLIFHGATSGAFASVFFQGNGNGIFTPQPTNVVPVAGSPNLVKELDFNNDSFLDLVVASSTLDLLLFQNDGTGQFTFLPPSLEVGLGASAITTADLNSNGLLDLIVTNAGGNNISVFMNRDDGLFEQLPRLRCGSAPRSIEVFDANLDGRLDMIATNVFSRNIAVLINPGNDVWLNPRIEVGRQPSAVVWGDFNQDNALDFAVTNSDDNTVSIVFNDGNNQFVASTQISVGAFPRSIVTADIENDDDLDLLVANRDSGTISVLRNNGTGGFQVTNFDGGGFGINTIAIEPADFNDDGFVDFAVANLNFDTVSVFGNDSTGSFSISSVTLAGDGPRCIAGADFDKDGNQDMVVGSRESPEITLLMNNGDMIFSSQTIPMPNESFSVAAADLNADGDVDIVSVSRDYSELTVMLNQGGNDPFFQLQIYDTGVSPRQVAIGLLDGDSHPDIVVANLDSDDVSVFINDGFGFFGPPQDYAGFNGPFGIAIADIDGDLDFDMAVSNNRFRDSVSIVVNDCLLFGDINLDGAVDLLDISGFVELVSDGEHQAEADINRDGVVTLEDVAPFIKLLTGG